LGCFRRLGEARCHAATIFKDCEWHFFRRIADLGSEKHGGHAILFPFREGGVRRVAHGKLEFREVGVFIVESIRFEVAAVGRVLLPHHGH